MADILMLAVIVKDDSEIINELTNKKILNAEIFSKPTLN